MTDPTSQAARHGEVVRRALAGISGTDPADWHLVGRVQHALLVVLRTVARQAGPGEVVTQPFAPVTAVAPVVSAGLRPRYADIDGDRLAMDPATVPGVSSAATRALVARHTFAAAAPVARLRDFVPEEVLLVEDSSHCLGHVHRDDDGEPVADVSVHNLGGTLTLPGQGGAAVWVNPALRERGPWHRVLSTVLAGLPAPGRREALAQSVGTPAVRAARRLGAAGSRAVTAAASAGLVELVVMPSERAGRVAGSPTAPTAASLRAATDSIPQIRSWSEHRRRTATTYRNGLAGTPGVTVPRLLDDPALTLVRYPLLLDSVARAEAVVRALRAGGLAPDRWYCPTLYPGPTDRGAFGYDPAGSPVAEDVARRVVTLQTAPFVTPRAAARAVDVVRDVVGTSG